GRHAPAGSRRWRPWGGSFRALRAVLGGDLVQILLVVLGFQARQLLLRILTPERPGGLLVLDQALEELDGLVALAQDLAGAGGLGQGFLLELRDAGGRLEQFLVGLARLADAVQARLALFLVPGKQGNAFLQGKAGGLEA